MSEAKKLLEKTSPKVEKKKPEVEEKQDKPKAKVQPAQQNTKKGSNPMREVVIDKLTLNMGTGEPGPKLENANKLLEKMSGKKCVITKTYKRNTFGVPKGRDTGVKVTLRGEEASQLLSRLLKAVENRIKPSQFDSTGNFSFGIAEYIHIPGIKYDPNIGIIGFDVAVTLKRRGYRIKNRRIRPAKVGKFHNIKKEEAIGFAKKIGINVSEDEE